MRSKAVLSIIAFLAAFAISVAVTPRQSKSTVAPFVKRGCTEKADAHKITNLILQDIENGRVRKRKLDSLSAYNLSRQASFARFAAATEEYVNASASIDDADLPLDFKTAWRSHKKAWQNRSDFLNQIRDDSPKRGGIDSDDGDVFPQKEFSSQSKEISATWYEVLRIARSYDAYVPPGAY